MSTRKAIDSFIRNEKEREIAALADRLAETFAKRAAIHDQEGSFPFDNFADLKQSGYLKLTVPKEFGGDEISLYELLIAQERLARGDGATALSVGWHVGLMLHYRYARFWPEELYARFCREVVENGAMINHFASERATGSPTRGGRPETKAVKTDGGWLISGRKTYSTLSPILEHYLVLASIEGRDEIGDFLVRKGPGVSVEETWNTMGMRATGSHDLVLENVFVADEDLVRVSPLGKRGQQPNESPGWQLHIPACYLGIAFAARDFAVHFARTYRPNSLPGPIADLPHIQHQIGLIEAELTTSRTLLYSVADRWDKNPEERTALKTELGLVKYVATNNAIQIVDKAMRIVGGASLSRSLPLERMYRDVRAGLHNPPMDDAVLRNLAQLALKEE